MNNMHNMRVKTGFTMIELLLGLAITAMLFAAVAVAFNASAVNYNQNENIFAGINSVRQALSRITTQLRSADAVDPNAASNECTFITADGQNITYRFNSGDSTLYLITNDDTSDDDYVLCENVNSMTFTRETFIADSQIKVKSVQISMSMTSGGVVQKLAAAAVIRRNLE